MTKSNKSEKEIENESLYWLNQQPGVFAIKIDNSAPYNEKLKTRVKKNKWMPPGIPDALVMLNGSLLRSTRVFWIEFKTEVGKQRVEQVAFEKKMLAFGIGYYVVRNVAEAQAALEREITC